MTSLKTWFKFIRPNFLTMTIVYVLLGFSLVIAQGFKINPEMLAITFAGAMTAHICVNVLNDYFDFKSGVDLEAHRTAVSGGSGLLNSGVLKASHAFYLGGFCLLATVLIGFYFIVELGFAIIPIGLIGLAMVVFYTTHLVKLGLGEFACGLGFAAMSIGTYFVQADRYTWGIAGIAGIPLILGFEVLLLNEFPDVDSDRAGNRRNIPIIFGLKAASKVAIALICASFAWVILMVILNLIPATALASLLLLPIGIKVAIGTWRHHGDQNAMINYLKLNVLFILVFPLITSAGLIIGSFFSL
jgi:1,4-dihydroxy-2-naphthoate octaprenyltransferase